MLAGLTFPAVHAADPPGYGSVRGIALDVGGKPISKASVAIHNLNGSEDRRVESDSDGIFAADSLNPGIYEIKASKEGLVSPPATTVEIARGQTVRPKVVLAAAEKPTAVAASASTTTAIEQELTQMKERIAALEAALLKAHSAPEAAPAPLSAPAPTASAAPACPHPIRQLRKSAAKRPHRRCLRRRCQRHKCRMLYRPRRRLQLWTISHPSPTLTLPG